MATPVTVIASPLRLGQLVEWFVAGRLLWMGQEISLINSSRGAPRSVL